MQRLQGQVVSRPGSPLTVLLVIVAALAVIALMLALAVVIIPIAIVGGLGFAAYRAVRGKARAAVGSGPRPSPMAMNDEGRQNVRVLRRSPPDSAEDVRQG